LVIGAAVFGRALFLQARRMFSILRGTARLSGVFGIITNL